MGTYKNLHENEPCELGRLTLEEQITEHSGYKDSLNCSACVWFKYVCPSPPIWLLHTERGRKPVLLFSYVS